MTTIFLGCTCSVPRYTTAAPRGYAPTCPVHGVQAREAASLRQRVETLESALRPFAHVPCTWGGNHAGADCIEAGRPKPCKFCRARIALETKP